MGASIVSAPRRFENAEFGPIDILEEDGRVLFAGTECAERLGYARPHNAIAAHCRDSLKRGVTDSLGRRQEKIFITEGDLYRLIVRSNLPTAERFERWVFDEVLPQIRKTGQYGVKELTGPELLARAVIEAQALLANTQARLAIAAPKANVYDRLVDADGLYLPTQAHKLLKHAGLRLNQREFFHWLEAHWCRRLGGELAPMAEVERKGWMTLVVRKPVTNPYTGKDQPVAPQAMVTAAGLFKLASLFALDTARLSTDVQYPLPV